MDKTLRALLIAMAASALADEPAHGPSYSPLIDASTVVKDLIVDLRYATANNFLKRPLYPKKARCLLLPTVAAKLAVAADTVRSAGFRLKVYDCYRPISVQWEMWKVMPKPGYVADPHRGSNHNRGAAVDLTLATLDSAEVEMPSGFDTFAASSHHGFSGGTAQSRHNREILRGAMESAGFQKNPMEWWHYDLPGAGRLPVLDVNF
jgi:zinc D-Ala-D-Ala dipeptidase